MAGRRVGVKREVDGKRAFPLTLSTREQHSRRHRATSNICSIETLIALMGAMHMALLGPQGLERLALRVASATEATKKAVTAIDGIELVDPKASNFREFAVKLPGEASEALAHLDGEGVLGGFDLGVWWADYGLSTCLRIGADERPSQSDIAARGAGPSSRIAGAGA